MIKSKPHHLLNMMEAVLWHGHVWLPKGLGHCCLLMMWCADICSRMNSVVYRAMYTFCSDSVNGAKMIRWYFTVKKDNGPKLAKKATQEDLMAKGWMFFNGRVSHLTLTWFSYFLFAKDKSESRMTQKQAATKSVCSKGLAKTGIDSKVYSSW